MATRWFFTLVVVLSAVGSAANLRVEAQTLPQPSPSPPPPAPCGGPSRLLATANRPTIGYSACAVKRDTAVFELGYQNEVRGTAQAGAVISDVPQNFLRLGVASRFEFDVIGPNYEATRSYAPGGAGTTTHGVTGSGLGVKYELPQAGRWTLAFDGLYTGPNGSPFLTAGNATLTLNFEGSYALSPTTGIGTTIAVSSTGGNEARGHLQYGVTMPSFVVTTQIPHFYQFYAEYVLVSKVGPDQGARAFTDFGVQKLLGSRTEIDLESGPPFTGMPSFVCIQIRAGAVCTL